MGKIRRGVLTINSAQCSRCGTPGGQGCKCLAAGGVGVGVGAALANGDFAKARKLLAAAPPAGQFDRELCGILVDNFELGAAGADGPAAKQPPQSPSYDAALRSVKSRHEEAAARGIDALRASVAGDSEGAAKAHHLAADAHEEAADQAEEDDGDGSAKHRKLAARHRDAAAWHEIEAALEPGEEKDMTGNEYLPVPPVLNWREVASEQRSAGRRRVRNEKAQGSNADVVGSDEDFEHFGMAAEYDQQGRQVRKQPGEVRGGQGFQPISGSDTDAIMEDNRQRLQQGSRSSYYGDDRHGTGQTQGVETSEMPEAYVNPPDNSSARRSDRLSRNSSEDWTEVRRQLGLPDPFYGGLVNNTAELHGFSVRDVCVDDALPIPQTTEQLVTNFDQYGRPRRR